MPRIRGTASRTQLHHTYTQIRNKVNALPEHSDSSAFSVCVAAGNEISGLLAQRGENNCILLEVSSLTRMKYSTLEIIYYRDFAKKLTHCSRDDTVCSVLVASCRATVLCYEFQEHSTSERQKNIHEAGAFLRGGTVHRHFPYKRHSPISDN